MGFSKLFWTPFMLHLWWACSSLFDKKRACTGWNSWTCNRTKHLLSKVFFDSWECEVDAATMEAADETQMPATLFSGGTGSHAAFSKDNLTVISRFLFPKHDNLSARRSPCDRQAVILDICDSNLEGLGLGFIEGGFCNRIPVWRLSTRSIRSTSRSTY